MHVRKGVLDLDVRCDVGHLHATRSQADRILELLPNLSHHICVNSGSNDCFGNELVGTELPHLLEHVIIELQGKACGGEGLSGALLTGHTSWLEELAVTNPEGFALMRVSVSFRNDFVALSAVREAVKMIEWLIAPEESQRPDPEEIVASLAQLQQ